MNKEKLSLKSSPGKYQQAFTLLELMVTIAIVGILASVSQPQYIQYIKRAKVSTAFEYISKVRSDASANLIQGVQTDIDPVRKPLEFAQCISVVYRGKECDVAEIEVWGNQNFSEEIRTGQTRLFVMQGQLNTEGSTVEWQCGTFRNAKKAIDAQYLPQNCRQRIPKVKGLCISKEMRKARNRCKRKG